MPFVKLDCGIINSTIWFDRPAREVFITALLMAEPAEFTEPVPQISVRSLDYTGWSAPPGWYGFVPASGPGIIDRAKVSQDEGKEALERLGDPETHSRTAEFEGRRMIRVEGGYLILNYMKYRDRDYTTAARSKRYRERKAERKASRRVTVSSRRDGKKKAPVTRDVTQAEAYVHTAEEDLAKNEDQAIQEDRDHAHTPPRARDDKSLQTSRDHGLMGSGAERRRHGTHAWCEPVEKPRMCVLYALHDEFVGRLANPDAEAQLRAWYPTVLARYPGAIGDDVWTFWRNEFQRWKGTVSEPVRQTPTTKEGRTIRAAENYLRRQK